MTEQRGVVGKRDSHADGVFDVVVLVETGKEVGIDDVATAKYDDVTVRVGFVGLVVISKDTKTIGIAVPLQETKDDAKHVVSAVVLVEITDVIDPWTPRIGIGIEEMKRVGVGIKELGMDEQVVDLVPVERQDLAPGVAFSVGQEVVVTIRVRSQPAGKDQEVGEMLSGRIRRDETLGDATDTKVLIELEKEHHVDVLAVLVDVLPIDCFDETLERVLFLARGKTQTADAIPELDLDVSDGYHRGFRITDGWCAERKHDALLVFVDEFAQEGDFDGYLLIFSKDGEIPVIDRIKDIVDIPDTILFDRPAKLFRDEFSFGIKVDEIGTDAEPPFHHYTSLGRIPEEPVVKDEHLPVTITVQTGVLVHVGAEDVVDVRDDHECGRTPTKDDKTGAIEFGSVSDDVVVTTVVQINKTVRRRTFSIFFADDVVAIPSQELVAVIPHLPRVDIIVIIELVLDATVAHKKEIVLPVQ
jgi:hypothetical protein